MYTCLHAQRLRGTNAPIHIPLPFGISYTTAMAVLDGFIFVRLHYTAIPASTPHTLTRHCRMLFSSSTHNTSRHDTTRRTTSLLAPALRLENSSLAPLRGRLPLILGLNALLALPLAQKLQTALRFLERHAGQVERVDEIRLGLGFGGGVEGQAGGEGGLKVGRAGGVGVREGVVVVL